MSGSRKRTIGILALQGDFEAHRKAFAAGPGVGTAFVRTLEELETVDALVLPGGESTAIMKLMARNGLDGAIRARAQAGMPVFGTCAGLILLAKSVEGNPDQPTLGLLDATVARNAFGRQQESFEADVPVRLGGADAEVRGVFIRAPYITDTGPGVEVLSRFRDRIVGARQGSLLGVAFHPELTGDARLHSLFAEMAEESRETR